MRLGQLVTHIPILNAAQLGQRFVFGQQGVLVNPADPGGIRPNLRRDALGHTTCRKVQVLQHARTRPVDVGAILKNNVDKGGTKERKPSHHLGLRDRQHGRGQRVSHLVFHHLRCLAGDFGVDDDLHIGQIGQRVYRSAQHGKNTSEHDEQRRQQHQKAVAA